MEKNFERENASDEHTRESRPEVDMISRLVEEKPWVREALGEVSPEQLATSEEALEHLDRLARAAAPAVEEESPGLMAYLSQQKGLLPLALAASVLFSPACKIPTSEERRAESEKWSYARKVESADRILILPSGASEAIPHLDKLRSFMTAHPEVQHLQIPVFEEKNENGGTTCAMNMMVVLGGHTYFSRSFVTGQNESEDSEMAIQVGLERALASAKLMHSR